MEHLWERTTDGVPNRSGEQRVHLDSPRATPHGFAASVSLASVGHKNAPHGFTTLKHHPEREPYFAAWAASTGKPCFGRPLTDLERLALELVRSRPTAFLTLDSTFEKRTEALAAWRLLRKRIDRARNKGRTRWRGLPYLGAASRGTGGGGWHVHALLWAYVPVQTILRPQALAVGFGGVCIRPIPLPQNAIPMDAIQIVAYVWT